MRKKKQKPIKPQGPWIITSYSDIQFQGEENEFDAGYIEFEHEETGIVSHHEMDWLRSERSYKGERPPSLLSIWNMFLKDTPGISGFVYRMTKEHIHVNWHITRKRGCFKHVLIDMSKRPPVSLSESIISDHSQGRIDMASFLRMLDGTQLVIEGRSATILNLNEMRKKKEA
ncbi:hypothetical protein KAR91_78990 [Candidatus Pacearchaeota archaeon]|nr:hypothetical protein [Candidatus Pacearchaeota archaeon]